MQPHAGAQTNMAVYMAALQPGDTILSLELAHGGHLTHGLKVNFSGRLYTIAHYGVSRETNVVDYDEVLRLAKEVRPKLIVCGGSAYPRTVETAEFRKIADEVDALLLCDMAHFAGLVAAGAAPEPRRRLRLRHVDDAQDAGRAALRLHPLQGGARDGGRPRGLPGNAGRAARAHDRREGDLLQDRDDRRVPRLPASGARERRRALRDADRGRARRPHRRHGHAPAPARPALDRLDGQGRRGAAARGQADRQPEHGSVRRAAADGGVGRADRDARGDDARLRRGRLPRGGQDHRRGARCREDADLDSLRSRAEDLCAKRPLYPGFRGFTTYVA